MGKELTRRFHAVIVAAKDTLAKVDETKHEELFGKMNAKRATLNEVIFHSPEDINGLEKKLRELEKVSRIVLLMTLSFMTWNMNGKSLG